MTTMKKDNDAHMGWSRSQQENRKEKNKMQSIKAKV
jgi:hypothetical protein